MKDNKIISICNIACAVLMLAMVVMTFLPYWGDVSIQSFVWLPEENNELMKTVTKQIPDFDMNDIALIPFVIMVCGLFGAFKCVAGSKNPMNALFGLICGGCGVFALLTHPVYAMGEGWILNLVVAALTLAAAVYPTIQIIPQITKNFTE